MSGWGSTGTLLATPTVVCVPVRSFKLKKFHENGTSFNIGHLLFLASREALITKSIVSRQALSIFTLTIGMEVLDMRDLWPEDIGPISDLKAPVVILREQASLLGKKTNNLVEAEVKQLPPTNRKFHYAFLIVAPALDNYRYELFTISHGINSYPIIIDVNIDIQEEIGTVRAIERLIDNRSAIEKIKDQREGIGPDDYKKIVARSEEEFVEILQKIFSAKKTKRVIGTILSMISYDGIDRSDASDVNEC